MSRQEMVTTRTRVVAVEMDRMDRFESFFFVMGVGVKVREEKVLGNS